MNQPEIIAETKDYFVLNKPAGMAVEKPSHNPTVGEWLVENGHIQPTNWAPDHRLGVVHRLDSDTSGVLLWAKNPAAQAQLKTLWQGRAVKKSYLALVIGECPKEGIIEHALVRDNKNDRQAVAWLPDKRARAAITEYRRIALGQAGDSVVSLVEAHPITGRTHQLRVHFKALGHPIIADKLYGEKSSDLAAKALGLERQFLHAKELCLPENQKEFCYRSELPDDLQQALQRAQIRVIE